jgi:hypothetical protein
MAVMHSHHIVSRAHAYRHTHHSQCYPSFCTSELLFFFFLYCILWREVTVHSPHLRGREFCSTFSKEEYFHKLFEIPLHR